MAQTALQELKTIVQGMIDNGGDADLSAVITHIKSLLPKERQIIEDAHIAGYGATINSSEYFTQNFNQ